MPIQWSGIDTEGGNRDVPIQWSGIDTEGGNRDVPIQWSGIDTEGGNRGVPIQWSGIDTEGGNRPRDMPIHSLAGQTLFYLCVVTGGAHIVYSRHGGSKEKVEGEEGKESGEKIHIACAHWNVNGMFG